MMEDLPFMNQTFPKNGILLQGNNLWVPKAGTKGEDLKFDNMANDLGVENGGWSWGGQFGDLNNDGNVDYLSDEWLCFCQIKMEIIGMIFQK